MAKKTVAAKKRNVKVSAEGQLHVHSSFNNIIVCLANSEGQVISWSVSYTHLTLPTKA